MKQICLIINYLIIKNYNFIVIFYLFIFKSTVKVHFEKKKKFVKYIIPTKLTIQKIDKRFPAKPRKDYKEFK